MDKRRYLIPLLLCLAGACYLGRAWVPKVSRGEESSSVPSGPHPQRIVSLAPSLTEILFALGLDERVVGVTQYCVYPNEAADKPRIGGYLTPNYEAILRVRPDLILTLTEHEPAREALDALQVPWQRLDHRSVEGILASIRSVGERAGVDAKAEALMTNLTARLRAVREKTRDLPQPRVLICLGRKMGSGTLKDAYVAGQGTLYADLLGRAGGQNAWKADGPTYPTVGAEGMLRINPEVIIDLLAGLNDQDADKEALLQEWHTLSPIEAVQRQRVYLFTQDYVIVPGPRFILLLEAMARALHPEVIWD